MHLTLLSYLLAVKSVISGTSVNWYILYTMFNVLFFSYIHPQILWFSSFVIRCCYFLLLRNKTDYRDKAKARCRLKTHARSDSSLNPTLKGMFGFYHQLCYWFNTCLYTFNGEPSLSTVRTGRVTIKYRAQICSQSHTHMDSSIFYWYLHQQSSRIWLCMNRMFTLPIANLHRHSWHLAPEQMWALGLSWHSRITASYCSGNALEMLWWNSEDHA